MQDILGYIEIVGNKNDKYYDEKNTQNEVRNYAK